MENNIKSECINTIKSKEIKTKEVNLPIKLQDVDTLLPVVIISKEQALIEIKKQYNNLKENATLLGLIKFTKSVVKIIAILIKNCFKVSASAICFIGISVLVIMSTAIITKNVVNSCFTNPPDTDATTYSIFQIKNDFKKSSMYKQDEKIQDNES